MEALLIDREECFVILNGKGEWGINLVPRLKLEDESEFRRIRLTDNKAKRDRDKTSETETKTDTFSTKLSQRKKARRDFQDPEKEKAQTNVSGEMSMAIHVFKASSKARYKLNGKESRQIPSSTEVVSMKEKSYLS